MASKQDYLRAALGPETAASFAGGAAGASVGVIAKLPDSEKAVARAAFADSLSHMWIVYAVFGALGLLISLFIKRNVLSKQHEETKTGLEIEEAKRREREAARAEKKALKARKAGKGINGSGDDVEKMSEGGEANASGDVHEVKA
jgi:hypothetical protein